MPTQNGRRARSTVKTLAPHAREKRASLFVAYIPLTQNELCCASITACHCAPPAALYLLPRLLLRTALPLPRCCVTHTCGTCRSRSRVAYLCLALTNVYRDAARALNSLLRWRGITRCLAATLAVLPRLCLLSAYLSAPAALSALLPTDILLALSSAKPSELGLVADSGSMSIKPTRT